jgi:glycosyltransferase involved in cell wall biosynthesis
MNIVLIDHYAGSREYGMEYRPYYIGRQWVRQGHAVTMLAASFSHLRIKSPAVTGRITEQWIEGIRYLWYRTPAYRGNGAARARNMFSFLRQIWLDARRLAKTYRPDVVIASSTYPMDIYPARRIARACSAKLVYEVHDIWPLSPIELGIISPWNPLAIVSQWAEDYACRHVDRLVALMPKAEDHFREHGLAAHKFACIPNGIEVEEWESADSPLPSEHASAVSTLRSRGGFLVGYAGSHNAANALDYLLEAAGLLGDTPVAFVLVGGGTHKERLQQQARQLGLTNVTFLPPIEKAAIPAFLKAMDALYIGWKKQPVYRFGISPNKLVDYMMSARPIIHAVEAGNDPVAETGCGISCPAEDPRAIAAAVKQLAARAPCEREAMGRRGCDFVVQHRQYPVLAKRFLDVIVDALPRLERRTDVNPTC